VPVITTSHESFSMFIWVCGQAPPSCGIFAFLNIWFWCFPYGKQTQIDFVWPSFKTHGIADVWPFFKIQTFFYKPAWSLCSIIFISDAYWSTARHLSAHLKLAIYGPVELFKYRHGWFLMIDKPHMGMNQYLLYHIFWEWASGFQLFDRLLIGVKGRHYPYL
jgi:hypothetical protein